MTDFQYQLLEVNFLSLAIICGAVVIALLAVILKRYIQKKYHHEARRSVANEALKSLYSKD